MSKNNVQIIDSHDHNLYDELRKSGLIGTNKLWSSAKQEYVEKDNILDISKIKDPVVNEIFEHACERGICNAETGQRRDLTAEEKFNVLKIPVAKSKEGGLGRIQQDPSNNDMFRAISQIYPGEVFTCTTIDVDGSSEIYFKDGKETNLQGDSIGLKMLLPAKNIIWSSYGGYEITVNIDNTDLEPAYTIVDDGFVNFHQSRGNALVYEDAEREEPYLLRRVRSDGQKSIEPISFKDMIEKHTAAERQKRVKDGTLILENLIIDESELSNFEYE